MPLERPPETEQIAAETDPQLDLRIEDALRLVRLRLQAGGDFPEEEFAAFWKMLGPVVGNIVSYFLDCILPDWGLNPAQVFREDIISYLRDQLRDIKTLQSYDFERPKRRSVTRFYATKFRWCLRKWLERNLGELEELKWRKGAKAEARDKMRLVKKELSRFMRLPRDRATENKIEDLKRALFTYAQTRGYMKICSRDDEHYEQMAEEQSKLSGVAARKDITWQAPIVEQQSEKLPKTKRGDVRLKDILQYIFRAVDELKEDDQTIVILSFLYGLNDKQISQEMGTGHALVRQRKCRALRDVNKHLQEKFPKLVKTAVETLKMAREHELLSLADEDIACLRDETTKEIARLYFREKKTLSEISSQLGLEEGRVREFWASIFPVIVDSRMTRSGTSRLPRIDWDTAGEEELDRLSAPLSEYIDTLPYGMQKPAAGGRTRGVAERKTAARFEELRNTADLLYLAYHPFEQAPRDLRRLFNERVSALRIQPESVPQALGLTSDQFFCILAGRTVVNAEQAVKLAAKLGVDPEDIFSAALATIAESTGG